MWITVLVFVLIFILLQIFIVKGVTSLQHFLNPFFKDISLLNVFQKLRKKIYLLGIFFALLLLLKITKLKLGFCIFKALTGFFFCLVLGDIFSLLGSLCFGSLWQNNPKGGSLFHRITAFFSVILGCIVVANNFGYSLSGFLTTLGIGGAAFAFAAQNTIANLWATLCILLERPFKLGDFISVGNRARGYVQKIQIRSTVLRTEDSNTVTIPNSIIVNECIENITSKNKNI